MFGKLKDNKDVIYRKTNANCSICYQEHLCNVLEFMKDFYPCIVANEKIRLDELFPGICKEIKCEEEVILQLVFSGLMVMERNGVYYVFDLSKAPSRPTSDSISDPEDIFGSRDGFVENFKENIALIRTRIKDDKLKIDQVNIGRRSKTIVSLLSIEDIHNQNIKEEIIKTLQEIDIDAVISIPDVMAYFQKDNLFPSYQYIGNPTTTCERLYNGEFIILIDRVCCAISLPTTLAYSSRMRIDNINIMSFSFIERFFVLISAVLAVLFCGIVCSFVTFQRDSLSLNVLSTIKVSQAGIILPIYLEIFLVLVLFELYYLIGFKQSKITVSSTIVLIGGLIIGENLVTSGLVGVFLIVSTAVCFLLSFVVSSNVTNILAISIIRVVILTSSLFYGLIGVCLVSVLIAYKMYNQRVLGVYYFYPFMPFDIKGIKRFFLANSNLKVNNRDYALSVKNKHRRKINEKNN